MPFTENIPLSLYIHIPWCIRKCPYCDFNSHKAQDQIPEQAYITALIQDLEQNFDKIADRTVSSIFIGGGTPSLFSPEAFALLFAAIAQRITLELDLEITLEANPGTVEQERFTGFREAGINRLSIGIQSFQEDKLKKLGRIHDSNAAILAAKTAHTAGFSTFNLDLMHGLPQQSLTDAMFDVETALALKPTHLSWYQLTIEPNTFFHRYPPQLPDDDALCEIQEKCRQWIVNQGFQQYEVSAYSLPNHHCRHNLNYWQFGDYLGIGAGAHSKITDVKQQTVTRFWKVKNPRDYLNPHPSFIGGMQTINEADLSFEFMLNALRLYSAIPLELFEQRTGLTVKHIAKPLAYAEKKGLLYVDKTHIATTDLGRRFLNNVVAEFLN